MIFPDKLDVLTIHARLIAETGGTQGLRDEALLESALTAARNRHHYETADVVRTLSRAVLGRNSVSDSMPFPLPPPPQKP